MVCKVLFFDCTESEKLFFQNSKKVNFNIKIFSESLNRKTIKELSDSDLNETSALNIYTPSILSADVINKFKNLRVVVIRSNNTRNIDLKTCLERNIAVVATVSDNDYKTVSKSLKAVTDVLCGCKENRVI